MTSYMRSYMTSYMTLCIRKTDLIKKKAWKNASFFARKAYVFPSIFMVKSKNLVPEVFQI